MAHVAYSFCMSMLHSLWQAALLLLVYFFADKIIATKVTPLQKRNFLFIAIFSQFILLVSTFFIYLFKLQHTVVDDYFGEQLYNLLPVDIITTASPWLCIIYLLAVSYKIIKSLYQWYCFKKEYYVGLQKPSIDLKLFTIDKAHHFGIKQKVQLWYSSTIKTPVTFGFFKPIILLPVALVNQLSLQQTETLILHELTHIKANDYLLNWFLILTESIFFFNPFIIIACKKIRLEREKVCDSTVIAFNYSPLLYAETLLQVQYAKQQYQTTVAAVTNKQQLLNRILYFTNTKNDIAVNRRKGSNTILATLLLLIFSTSFLFQHYISTIKQPVNNSIAKNTFIATPNELNIPQFVNNVSEIFTDENLKKIEEEVSKQQPIIEKHLQNLAPFIQAVQDKAKAIADEAAADNEVLITNDIATPASLPENTVTKQILVKEEQSGSKNATVKVYTIAYLNNQWVLIPEWMLAAREVEIPFDSLQNAIDTFAIPAIKQ